MSWRGDARRALREYARAKRRQAEVEQIRVTPSYSGMPGAHIASRTTEDVALRSTLTDREEAVISAVEFAMRMQGSYQNGEERLRMMRLVYIARTHTLEGAALECHYSVDALKRWSNEILTAVYCSLKRS